MYPQTFAGLCCIVALALAGPPAGAAPIDGTFNYQGRLTDGGAAVTGTADLKFRLYDTAAAGTQIGSEIELLAVPVTGGLFDVDLDFGAASFNGDQRWIEIDARSPAGVGGYTTLSPRQPIAAAPYALYALNGSGGGLWDTNGSDISNNNAGNVGIGTTTPQHLLHVVGDTNAANAIYGFSTELANTAAGVFGQSASSSGYGVYGYASALNGSGTGVFGKTDSSFGYGVFAHASHPLGQTYGVYSDSRSTTGTGVYGEATSNTGTTYGVYGKARSATGTGLYGYASSATGFTYGVRARVTSPDGYAGRFDGRSYFSGDTGFGALNPQYPIHANSSNSHAIYATAPNDTAIRGEGLWGIEGTSIDPNGRGLFGFAASITGTNYGVYGLTPSENGRGVYGYATGTSGSNYGVYGESASGTGRGVYGFVSDTSGVNHGVHGESDSVFGRGVVGHATSTTGTTQGVRGEVESPDGIGVLGRNDAATGDAWGVFGQSASVSGYGVYGISAGTNATGVIGVASAATGTTYAVYGACNSEDGYAFFANSAGTDYGSQSSIRWKHNVKPIDDPLGKLAQIRGVYFDWDAEHGGTHDVGMIAEEVGAVMPEIVNYEANGVDAHGMDYSRTTPLLVEAVNALRAEKDAEISELREELAALRDLLHQLSTQGDAH